MTDPTQTQIRVSGFKQDISKIKHIVESHILYICGNVFKKNGHIRAYFPQNVINEVSDIMGELSWDAYYDLVSGEFVCTVAKTNTISSEEFKNTYRDVFTQARAEMKKKINESSNN